MLIRDIECVYSCNDNGGPNIKIKTNSDGSKCQLGISAFFTTYVSSALKTGNFMFNFSVQSEFSYAIIHP